MQLAAREGRLEHIAGVHRSLCRAGADDGVDLVDEENDLARAAGHFLEHRLEPLFELAAKLGAGDQCAQIEHDDALVFQSFGNVAVDHAAREALDDGGLADAGVADQRRIVLGAAREHLNHAADLLVAANDRIKLALARPVGEIDSVLFQRAILRFRILRSHSRRAADSCERLQDAVFIRANPFEDLRGGPALFSREREQDVFSRSEVILERGGLVLRRVEHFQGALREVAALAAVNLRDLFQLLF